MTKHHRCWWAGKALGWQVDTTIALSAERLNSYRMYLLKVQKERAAGLAPGAVRDDCLDSIKALEEGKISQNIAGVGERVLFDAYKSDKIISLGT